MNGQPDVVERLSQLALFGDLTQPQLQSVALSFDEEVYGPGQRVLRQGLTGSGFHLIIDGEAAVLIDGAEVSRLSRGDFFGEISVLTGEPPSADVQAATMLRCLVVPGPELETFLLAHPKVLLRMLRAEARRVRSANRWQS